MLETSQYTYKLVFQLYNLSYAFLLHMRCCYYAPTNWCFSFYLLLTQMRHANIEYEPAAETQLSSSTVRHEKSLYSKIVKILI